MWSCAVKAIDCSDGSWQLGETDQEIIFVGDLTFSISLVLDFSCNALALLIGNRRLSSRWSRNSNCLAVGAAL